VGIEERTVNPRVKDGLPLESAGTRGTRSVEITSAIGDNVYLLVSAGKALDVPELDKAS